jgi:hypothetical protein
MAGYKALSPHNEEWQKLGDGVAASHSGRDGGGSDLASARSKTRASRLGSG